jgi:hypothetical protein
MQRRSFLNPASLQSEMGLVPDTGARRCRALSAGHASQVIRRCRHAAPWRDRPCVGPDGRGASATYSTALIVVLGQAPRCLSRTAPSNGTGWSLAISTGSPNFGEAKQRYFPGHHPSHGPLVGTGFVP